MTTPVYLFLASVREFWYCITAMTNTVPQRMHVTLREWQWVLVVAANSLPPISVLNHPINLAFDKGSCDRTSLSAISSPSLLLSGMRGKREKGCVEGVLIYSFNSCQCSSLSLFQRANGACGQKHHHQITLSHLSSLSFSLALSLALFHCFSPTLVACGGLLKWACLGFLVKCKWMFQFDLMITWFPG